MSNYVEYEGEFAFHPGYYIEECIEESGLTIQEFAKKLGISFKHLKALVEGELSLSFDTANKLSALIGTSVDFWINLQKAYDSQIKKFEL